MNETASPIEALAWFLLGISVALGVRAVYDWQQRRRRGFEPTLTRPRSFWLPPPRVQSRNHRWH